MKEVQEFLKSVFTEEMKTHVEYRKENNMERFNKQLEILDSFTINSSPEVLAEIGLGLGKMYDEHDEDFLDIKDFLPEIKERYFYKISTYSNSKYKTVFACYVSLANPESTDVRLLSKCLLLGNVGSELKIISIYFPDYDTGKWKFGGGDVELKNFYEIGELQNIERVLEPSKDDWSKEEFERNQ